MIDLILLAALSGLGQVQAEGIQADAKPRAGWLNAFTGSELRLQTSANLNAFAPRLQLTQNPTVETSVLFAPRYYAGSDISIAAQFAIGYEWTNSDSTTTLHEPDLSDTSLSATWSGLPKPWKLNSSIGASLDLPTSKVSRARTLIFAPGLQAGISRSFEVGGGSITTGLRGTYKHPIYSYSTPGVVEPVPYARHCFGGATGCIDQGSGFANVQDQLGWQVSLSGKWGDFSPSILFQMTHQFPYRFSELPGVASVEDPTHVRNLTNFGLGVAYTPLDWLSVELGYSMQRNLIGGSGTRENPFFDPDEDMRVYLEFGFSFPG